MKLKEYIKVNTDLKSENIDTFSEWLVENLTAIGIEKRNCLKARLLTEEILLRLRDKFGEDVQIKAEIESSFHHHKLRLTFDGEPFNPLSETNAELGEWNSSLQTAIGLSFKYANAWGKNILKLSFPVKRMNPVLKIFLFLAAGILLAVCAKQLLPAAAQTGVTKYFLDPAYAIWNSILNTVSAPIIFFTVITTVLNTKQIDRQGGNSLNVVLRYFLFSFLISLAAALFSVPVFLESSQLTLVRNDLPGEITKSITAFFPNNIIEPFLTSNTPQLLLMAFALSTALVVLGDNVDMVKRFVRQTNVIGLKMAEWVSLLVPLFACISLILGVLNGESELFSNMWQPLVCSIALSLVVMFLISLLICVPLKVSPILLGRKIQQPFFTALKTGSLDTSFEQTKHSCVHLLGIDKLYTDLSLPQGLVLYMPISAIGTLIFTVYTARAYNVPVDLFWIVCAIILAVMLFVATPPVPGANLLAYVVFFASLGIPKQALMTTMIFDIVFGIFAGAGNQMLLQLELIWQAKRIGVLERDKLGKPLKRRAK